MATRPLDSPRAPSDLVLARIGALAGALVGLGLGAVVLMLHGYVATRGQPDSHGRALAGSLLVSAVLAFPSSQWLVPLLPAGRGPASMVLIAAVAAMPLVNWVAIGLAAGAIADVIRLLMARRR